MVHFRRFILLLAALLISTQADASCAQWSKTASANATADPSINWATGMSPSSVDASGRAMMARTAECRDDYSGLLVQGGTSTAYTLTTYQGLAAAPNDGQLLGFTVANTNGAGVTLTVDGGTAFPIQSAAGTAVSSGTLIAGSPYTVKFSSGASAWVLRDFYGQPFTIPIGAMLPYTGTTAPNSNFVLPYGQCISRTTYATYFSQVSTTFGVCNGTTTFGVPDMRGRTIAAVDNLGGSAASRLTTTYFGTDPTVLGNVGGAQNQSVAQANLPNITLNTSIGSGQGSHAHGIHQQTTGGINNSLSSGSAIFVAGAATNMGATDSATLPSMSGTTPLGGSASPMTTVQPTLLLTFILRIL